MNNMTETHFREIIYQLQLEIRNLKKEIDTLKYLFCANKI
jgi:hypothetical protein